MQHKLTLLIALADRPEGQATLDELDDEVARLILEAGKKIGSSVLLSALDHVDIFQTGLVARKGDILRITENGRSLLRALRIALQESSVLDFPSTLQSLKLIDDLIGSDARVKIFELGSRSIDRNADLMPADETTNLQALSDRSRPAGASRASNDRPTNGGRPAAMSDEKAASLEHAKLGPDAPAFLTRKFSFWVPDAPPLSNLLSGLATRMQKRIHIWRRNLEQDQPSKGSLRSDVNLERGLLVMLSLLAVVSGAGAVASLTQVKSLKSELATLRRELVPLRERAAKFDQIERSKEVPDDASDKKIQSSRVARAENVPLLLSGEEIQLVREYIKPAPVAGASTPLISIGDPFTGPTVPFPSPVTEKVPKLLGARFAIKNGAIIIVGKDSRQADAVLGPN